MPCSRATAEIEFISEIEEIYNKRQKRQQQVVIVVLRVLVTAAAGRLDSYENWQPKSAATFSLVAAAAGSIRQSEAVQREGGREEHCAGSTCCQIIAVPEDSRSWFCV